MTQKPNIKDLKFELLSAFIEDVRKQVTLLEEQSAYLKSHPDAEDNETNRMVDVVDNLAKARELYIEKTLGLVDSMKTNSKEIKPPAVFEIGELQSGAVTKHRLYFMPGLKKFPEWPADIELVGGLYRYRGPFQLNVAGPGVHHDHYEYGTSTDNFKHGFSTLVKFKFADRSFEFVSPELHIAEITLGKKSGERIELSVPNTAELKANPKLGKVLWVE